MGAWIARAEADEDENAAAEPEAEREGAVDESLQARRLRRWLRGMFGGSPEPAEAPPERD